MTIDQLESELFSLPRGERARLAERLISSLDEELDRVTQAWAEEADRRYQSFLRGETTPIPAAQVFAELQAELES
jgi:putative addiction module component (TIGR02574 family)